MIKALMSKTKGMALATLALESSVATSNGSITSTHFKIGPHGKGLLSDENTRSVMVGPYVFDLSFALEYDIKWPYGHTPNLAILSISGI